jgi:hypothetical protein
MSCTSSNTVATTVKLRNITRETRSSIIWRTQYVVQDKEGFV